LLGEGGDLGQESAKGVNVLGCWGRSDCGHDSLSLVT
jgi:hypothetical protein